MNEMRHEIEAFTDVIINDRRTLHRMPEVGFDLPKTTDYVVKRLTEMGYEPKIISQSAVAATVGKQGKTILIRADMDALPAKEESGLAFASENEFGHLCGHDMHTAILLGVAQLLKNHEHELNGTVKLMFQPAEERGLGARAMVEAGVMDGVDAAIALHVDSLLDTGKITFKRGIASSLMDSFYIKVTGKGAHGSAPHLAIDPLLIVNTIYMSLNGLVGKEVAPNQTAVLTIGKMGGGTAVNIIPETAVIEGAVRCYDKDVRDHLVKRIYEIIEQTTTMLRGTYEVTKSVETPAVFNDPQLCDLLIPVIGSVIGEENLIEKFQPMSGTEDFAYVSGKVPAMYMMLGASAGSNYPMHNPKVIFSEAAIPIGIQVLAKCAMEWLEK